MNEEEQKFRECEPEGEGLCLHLFTVPGKLFLPLHIPLPSPLLSKETIVSDCVPEQSYKKCKFVLFARPKKALLGAC